MALYQVICLAESRFAERPRWERTYDLRFRKWERKPMNTGISASVRLPRGSQESADCALRSTALVFDCQDCAEAQFAQSHWSSTPRQH